MANFLFVLSKDSNESATRCMQFAKIAHSKGHHVDMFFIDGGVTWADKDRDLSQNTDTGDCPADYLPYLVENEIAIGICTPCAKARRIGEEDLIEGARLGTAAELIHLACDAAVISL